MTTSQPVKDASVHDGAVPSTSCGLPQGKADQANLPNSGVSNAGLSNLVSIPSHLTTRDGR